MTNTKNESYIKPELKGEELEQHEENVFNQLRGHPFVVVSHNGKRPYLGTSNISNTEAINFLLNAALYMLDGEDDDKENLQ